VAGSAAPGPPAASAPRESRGRCVVAARADSGAEPRARQAGFDAFLRKPIGGLALAAALSALLAPAGGTEGAPA